MTTRLTAPLELTGRYYRLFPPEAPLGTAYENLVLHPARTALLLIDVYGKSREELGDKIDDLPAFLRPAEGDRRPAIISDQIAPAKRSARKAGIKTIYVTNYLSPGLTNQSEWRNMSLRTCDADVLKVWQPPTEALAYPKSIAPDDEDIVVQKQLYSGFFETHLDSLLRSLDIHTVVLVGFDSRICLATTATEAMYRNFRVIVVRDATDTYEYPETRDAGMANFLAIRFIESSVGYTCTTQEFIDACEGSAAASNSSPA